VAVTTEQLTLTSADKLLFPGSFDIGIRGFSASNTNGSLAPTTFQGLEIDAIQVSSGIGGGHVVDGDSLPLVIAIPDPAGIDGNALPNNLVTAIKIGVTSYAIIDWSVTSSPPTKAYITASISASVITPGVYAVEITGELQVSVLTSDLTTDLTSDLTFNLTG